MRVFKFGGASVKDAAGIKNVYGIKQFKNKPKKPNNMKITIKKEIKDIEQT